MCRHVLVCCQEKAGYDLLELPELPFPASSTASPGNEEGRERGETAGLSRREKRYDIRHVLRIKSKRLSVVQKQCLRAARTDRHGNTFWQLMQNGIYMAQIMYNRVKVRVMSSFC